MQVLPAAFGPMKRNVYFIYLITWVDSIIEDFIFIFIFFVEIFLIIRVSDDLNTQSSK